LSNPDRAADLVTIEASIYPKVNPNSQVPRKISIKFYCVDDTTGVNTYHRYDNGPSTIDLSLMIYDETTQRFFEDNYMRSTGTYGSNLEKKLYNQKHHITWRNRGVLHRESGPAELYYYLDNS